MLFRSPRFSAMEIAFLDGLLPHMESALSLHHRLDRVGLFADIAREQLRHSGNGIVVLSRSGSLLFADVVGRQFVDDPRVFTVRQRSIGLRDASANEVFGELVRQCVPVSESAGMMAGGTLRVPVVGTTRELLLAVLPFRALSGPATLSSDGARAVLTLFDPARPVIDTRQDIRGLYGLSAAEADVCWKVANGETIARIAARSGLSRETVRSQLKRVFAKTGTKRQPDLVRLVLQGPSSWLGVMQ